MREYSYSQARCTYAICMRQLEMGLNISQVGANLANWFPTVFLSMIVRNESGTCKRDQIWTKKRDIESPSMSIRRNKNNIFFQE